MNSGRFWLIAAVLAGTAFIVSPGCGSGTSAPCSTCPAIEGTYELEFAPGALPADCTAIGVQLPRGPLEIERTGPNLSASLDGVALSGTLFQSYDFTLLSSSGPGDGGTDTFTLNGRYIPQVTDGGTAQLTGTFSGNYSRTPPQGTRRCTLTRSYTATQE
ncbi:MAG TPA: hypothetical protein VF815_19925 [Myxococcaceae bacterium]|jgi:hypothetical protein